jgi:cell division protein FtsL
MDLLSSLFGSTLRKIAAIVFLIFCVSISLLLARNISLQKQNNGLNDEIQSLKETVEKKEDENGRLSERISKFEDEKKKIEDELENLKRENESLGLEAKKSEGLYQSAAEEKSYLEEILINKTKEIEKLKKQPASPAARIPAAEPAGFSQAVPADLSEKIRQKEEEIRRLTEQNAALAKKLERLYQTANQKITEISAAKIALEETIAEARKIIDNEFNTVNLGSITVDRGTGNTFAKPEKPKEIRKTPKKEGRVLAVNEDHGFVIVDMGKADGIKPDTTFALNKDGSVFGTLAVLEVRDAMSACNIKDLNPGRKIQINDLVLVQR